MKYTVKKGDTLSAIAAANHVTVAEIVYKNSIENPDIIHVGQVLDIPSANNYNELGAALEECLDAIEALPEFHNLLEKL